VPAVRYANCPCCGSDPCKKCPDLNTITVTFNCGANGIKNRTIAQCLTCANYCSHGPYTLDYLESVYIAGLGCVSYWEGAGETCAYLGSHVQWIRCSIEYFDESGFSDLNVTIYRDSSKASTLASWSYNGAFTAPTIWNCSDVLPDLTTVSQQLSECQWSLSTSTSDNPTVTIAP
jgi:hypothetical protein